MRDELGRRAGLRSRYRGTVARFGSKPAYRGPAVPTVLLCDVQDARGAVVTDHLWFVLGKSMARLCLEIGDVVEFEARVTPYLKGYAGREDFESPREMDYRLSYPTRMRRVVVEAIETLPLFTAPPATPQ